MTLCQCMQAKGPVAAGLLRKGLWGESNIVGRIRRMEKDVADDEEAGETWAI